jgi:hypothetical protein
MDSPPVSHLIFKSVHPRFLVVRRTAHAFMRQMNLTRSVVANLERNCVGV